MKKLICLSFLFWGMECSAQQNLNIVPMPAEVKLTKNSFTINEGTVIYYNSKEFYKEVTLLSSLIKKYFGLTLKEKLKKFDYPYPSGIIPVDSNAISIFQVDKRALADYDSAQYILSTGKRGIVCFCQKPVSAFYAIQTLTQIFQDIDSKNTKIIPGFTINDTPRFAYRGMHLDVSRHFFPVDFIKKYIDYLAAYKFNTFHWHLTDDQGWRIEIKKYPLLTQVGSCRAQTLIGNYGSNKYDGTKYCGYYTQEQIKEIVKYAADRYITVIPEIEMPGHAVAALTSYPYLGCTKGPYKVWETWGVSDDVFCAGNDSTYQFIENVLDEVMQLFPSKYIHVGGDECPKVRWKDCPVCQKRIKDEGLKDENALQSYFVQRIEKYLNSKGRKIIGWDEILEGGLAANATVMSWRGEDGGIAAAKQNHDVIMTPGSNCYLDHSQSTNEDSITIGGYLPLENVYNYEPVPPTLSATEAKHVLGAQGNVWTEYITNTSKVEYMIFPRMIALSEVLWTPKEKRSWSDFERRLPTVFKRLDKEKINYSKAYYDLSTTVLPTANNEGVIWRVESKNKNSFLHIADGLSGYGLYDFAIETDTAGEGLGGTAIDSIKRDVDTTKSVVEYHVIGNAHGKYSGADLSFNPLGAESLDKKSKKQLATVGQNFYFNKATGKKITLTSPPSKSYPGDGAFTLVNGVQNDKGFSKSSEFLGFQSDCEAVVDLGKNENCSKVIVHALTQQASWIWQPSRVTVFYSTDGINYKSLGLTEDFITSNSMNGTMTVNFSPVDARFIKVWIANEGKIPDGNPGAGNEAWLFVDEIEVE